MIEGAYDPPSSSQAMNSPGQRGPPLNYFVYPYVEVDGIPWDKVEYRFVVKDLPQTARRPQKGKPIERRTIVADHAGAVAEKAFGKMVTR